MKKEDIKKCLIVLGVVGSLIGVVSSSLALYLVFSN